MSDVLICVNTTLLGKDTSLRNLVCRNSLYEGNEIGVQHIYDKMQSYLKSKLTAMFVGHDSVTEGIAGALGCWHRYLKWPIDTSLGGSACFPQHDVESRRFRV